MKQLRRIKAGVLCLIDKFQNAFRGYMRRNWKDTQISVYYLAIFLISILGGLGLMELSPYPLPGFIIGVVWGFLLGNLILKVSVGIICELKKLNTKQLLCIVVILAVSGELGMLGNLGNDSGAGLLFGLGFGIAAILLVKSIWAFFHNRIHTPTVLVTGFLSALVVACGCIVVGGEGFTDTYVEYYLDAAKATGTQNTISQREADGFCKELEQGDYTVQSIEYGVDTDAEIVSGCIDLSYCAQNPDGLDGVWRSIVSDYDVNEAPIAGKVWYPKEISNCPVLFFAHGNHNILTESYLGYAYLGEYLASHGYVVVSVDENVLNMLSYENDARAILFLENIKKLQTFNREEGNPLYGKMDYDRIVIGGHSRGGEMAATAYLFNGYDCYPENGMKKFYYDFNICGVIAVAPSVNQYMPADHEVVLENANYLLIQGANDQDINMFMGTIQYENVEFTEDDNYIKSSLYISGANHGQFNSLWGTYDISEPVASFLNVKNFLTMEEQQDILKIYTKIFLDKVLKQDETYAELLINQQAYAEYLPRTIYIQQYARSGEKTLCNYEEDSNLTTASEADIVLEAEHMRIWREEMMYYSNEDSQMKRDNYALRLKWSDTKEAAYRLRMKQTVSLKESGIALDICNMQEEDVDEEMYEILQPQLLIRDRYGNEARIDTAELVDLYPALPVKLGKLQYLSNSNEYKHQYQTIQVTAKQLMEQCPSLVLSDIREIILEFPENETGDISVDNIRIL